MNSFHLETQGLGNRITSLIPVSFAKLSNFSLFPFAILLSQAKFPEPQISSSHCLFQRQPNRVWKNHCSTIDDVANDTFSACVMLMERYQNIATVFSLWIMGETEKVEFFPVFPHPCCHSSRDQLTHKVCSWNDLTKEPGPVPGRSYPLVDTAKEGALCWHFAVESWGIACCGSGNRDCSPLIPLIPEVYQGRCYLLSSFRGQWG